MGQRYGYSTLGRASMAHKAPSASRGVPNGSAVPPLPFGTIDLTDPDVRRLLFGNEEVTLDGPETFIEDPNDYRSPSDQRLASMQLPDENDPRVAALQRLRGSVASRSQYNLPPMNVDIGPSQYQLPPMDVPMNNFSQPAVASDRMTSRRRR